MTEARAGRSVAGEGLRAPSRLAVPSVMLTVLIWGSYYPVIEHLLLAWDPVTLSWFRNVLAAAALALILFATEGPRAFLAEVPWRAVWLIGAIGVAANIVLSSYGVAYSGAVPAALIAGSTPVLAAIMAWLVYGQRPSRLAGFAILLAVAGVSVVILGGGAWDGSFRGGEILVIVGNVTWVWYMVMVQRVMPAFSQLRSTTLTMVTGALALTAAYGAMRAFGYAPVAYDLGAESMGLVFFSAVVSIAFGTLSWNFGVSRLGVTATSLFSNLVPVVAVVIAVLWGGAMSWLQGAGGALVILAVLLIQAGPRLLRRAALSRTSAAKGDRP